MERDLIRTRTAEGRSRAKAQGKHMGRPPSLTPAQQKEAIRRRAQGATLDELARSYNVSRATISRLAAAGPAPNFHKAPLISSVTLKCRDWPPKLNLFSLLSHNSPRLAQPCSADESIGDSAQHSAPYGRDNPGSYDGSALSASGCPGR